MSILSSLRGGILSRDISIVTYSLSISLIHIFLLFLFTGLSILKNQAHILWANVVTLFEKNNSASNLALNSAFLKKIFHIHYSLILAPPSHSDSSRVEPDWKMAFNELSQVHAGTLCSVALLLHSG